MTNPPPPASPTPTASPEPSASPKRPWTILGRLSKAVREQNWFAVALELVIVVLGVVIGFQVTAWGQARSDAGREQTYLHLLAADLRQTQRTVSHADSLFARADRAAVRLVQSFYEQELPPPDSLHDWLRLGLHYYEPRPVMGTVDALISSGDLQLIGNDSLRTAITSYREHMSELEGHQRRFIGEFRQDGRSIVKFVDINMVYTTLPQSVQDSLAQNSEYHTLPNGPNTDLAPIDVGAFFANAEARAILTEMVRAKRNLKQHRTQLDEWTGELLVRVEAELNR